MANNIKGITIEIGGDTTKLDKALKGTNQSIKSTQSELREVERLLKMDPGNTEAMKQKQDLLTKAVGETKEKLDILKDAEKQVEEQFKNGEASEEQYRAIKREVEATEAQLKSLEKQAADSNVTLTKVGEAFENVGAKSEEIGKKLMPVTAAIGGGGVAAATMASNFEDAMAKVSTIANETEVPIDELEKAILDLSDQTGISATDIADNVYNAISAGQSTGDAVNFVSNAIKLAKAGFTDSASSLDILTTAMNAYGMEADQVTRVSDLLIQTQNLGKTTVGELSSSMGKVIPTAKANNVEMEQLCAAYSILTANGIATAESTTYMNAMLNELGKGGSGVDKILREQTGQSFAELSESGKSVGDVLQILNDYADETGQSFGDLWSSSEAGKAGLVLLGDGADTFNQRLGEMNNAYGATDTAFAKLDTTSNQAKIAINQLKNTAIELGGTLLDTLAPVIQGVVQKVKEFSEWFKTLTESQKQTIIVIAGIVAALGPALIAFGKVCTGISSIINVAKMIGSAITAAKTAFAAFNAVLAANPIILIVAAIVAVIAILVTLYNKCEWFRNGVNAIWDAIKTAFFVAFDGIKTFFTETLPNAFNTVVDFIKNNWQALLLLIVNPFAGAFALLYNNCDAFREFIDNFVAAIKQFFQDLWNGIVAIFTGVGTWFTDRFTEAWNGIVNVFSSIGTWFGARWTDIKTALATVAEWFRTMFQNAWTNVTSTFAAIGTWFGARWTDIKTALATVAEWFRTMFQNAWTNVTSAFAAIGTWFGARWTDIKTALATVAEWFRTMFQNAWTNITTIFSEIGSWFDERWTEVTTALANVAEWFKQQFDDAWTNITTIFSEIGSWFDERWTEVTTALANVPEWFKQQFDDAWTNIKDAFANVTSFFSDLWTEIKDCFVNVGTTIGSAVGDAFKSAINSCLATIEGVVNKFIGMINGVIGIINEIPGVSLGEIDTLSLPRLAKGGVLKQGTAMVAEAGPELISMVGGNAVVTPLTGTATNSALNKAAAGNTFEQNINITSPRALTPYEVARQTRIQTRSMILAMGKG